MTKPVVWRWMSNGKWCYTDNTDISDENRSAMGMQALYSASGDEWQYDLTSAPVTEHGALPKYLLITNGSHVGVGFRQFSDDPDDYEWQDETTAYVPDVIAWRPLPSAPQRAKP